MSVAARAIHGVNVCVIPRPENDHRPLLLRHRPLAFISAMLLLVKIAAIGLVGLTPTPAQLSTITASRIVQLTNAERVEAGLSPLAQNSKLTKAAQEKGAHMLAEDYFAHISPSGVTPWFWMNKAGYAYQVAGENLAIDFVEAENVVAAWLASPSHKENMLHSSYTETGVAVVTGEFQGGTSTIVVHMFGLPAGAQVAAETTKQPAATPAPSASPTLSPAATPAPTLAPTPVPVSPPRVPRIALLSAGTVRDSVRVALSGEAGSTAHVLLNSQDRTTVVLDENGEGSAELSLEDFPDGIVTLRAYASSAGGSSGLSSPLTVAKDTTAPELAAEQLQFFLAPRFDTQEAFLLRPELAAEEMLINGEPAGTAASLVRVGLSGDSVVIGVRDAAGNVTELSLTHLKPAFDAVLEAEELSAPRAFWHVSSRFMVSVIGVLLVLLTLAVVVQIRIQKPAMIAHASLVLLLAGVLWIL